MADPAPAPATSSTGMSISPALSSILTQVGIGPDQQRQISSDQTAVTKASDEADETLKKNKAKIADINAEPLPPGPDSTKLTDMPGPYQAPPQKDPKRVFLQFLPVLGMLAGGFVKNNASASLDAATAAITAAKSNDQAALEKAHQQWLDNMDYAVKSSDHQAEQIRLILDDRKMAMDEKQSRIAALAAENDNSLLSAHLREGNLDGAYKMADMMSKAAMALKTYKLEVMKANALGGALNGPGVQDAAWQFIKTGIMPTSMGRNGQAQMAVRNAAAQILQQEYNMTPEQAGTYLATRQSDYKADSSSLTALEKQKTLAESFEKTALANLDLAIQESDKTPRGQSPIINRWILAGKRSIGGDPEVGRFNAALTSALNEYAKVLSGSTGGSSVTDAARREADQLLSTANTPEQVRQIVQIMRTEMQNRVKGFDDQEAQVNSSLGGGPAAGGDTPAPQSPLPPPPPVVRTYNPKTGKIE